MDSGRFSLTRISLRNFRSIASADLRLDDLLVLVGPNGSGKSNVLDSLRFVSDSLQTSLDQELRARGGVGEVRRRSTGHPTHLVIQVDFRTTELTGTYEFEIGAVRGGGFRIAREQCGVWRADAAADAEGRWFRVANGELTSSEAVMPPVSNDRLYLVAAAGIAAFRPVFDGLAGIAVFNLNPDVMRQPQPPASGEVLNRDGSNIASVFHRLQELREDGVTSLVDEYLRRVVPGMHGVSRKAMGPWETLTFRQDVPGATHPWTFEATSVSDGTLGAVGILVALFARTGGVLSPVGIEEPEAALHPAATGVLLDALRDASQRRQVLVTSHSPDLLDRHDISARQIRAVRAIRGETIVGELDAAGELALREDLFTPGELLRNDQLHPADSQLPA